MPGLFAVKEKILGYLHRLIDAGDRAVPGEAAVLRWNQEVEKKAQWVLDEATYAAVVMLQADLFKARLRKDYREWFNDNRREMWSDVSVTLMQLAIEAKAYEGTDTHTEKSRQLAAAYKKQGTMAMVHAMEPNAKFNNSQWTRCYLCENKGHAWHKCPLMPALRSQLKQANEDTAPSQTTVSVVKYRNELSGLRSDVAHLANSTQVDHIGFTEETQREMGY